MAFEHRENSGSLFRNDKREKDTQPHARGDALIGGVLYEISAWTKDGAKGKFQSLAFKPKDPPAAPKPQTTPFAEDLDDDLPF
jgi:hypothetical protein